jgi:hypothetical protein
MRLAGAGTSDIAENSAIMRLAGAGTSDIAENSAIKCLAGAETPDIAGNSAIKCLAGAESPDIAGNSAIMRLAGAWRLIVLVFSYTFARPRLPAPHCARFFCENKSTFDGSRLSQESGNELKNGNRMLEPSFLKALRLKSFCVVYTGRLASRLNGDTPHLLVCLFVL